jgi:hypothetical protein
MGRRYSVHFSIGARGGHSQRPDLGRYSSRRFLLPHLRESPPNLPFGLCWWYASRHEHAELEDYQQNSIISELQTR